jgi:adenosylmethionine-8-amino-7-oxononanoate aminotransferase
MDSPERSGAAARLVAGDRRHVWHPFTQEATAPDPVPVVSGEGAVLQGADGREYLDLIASWWVNLHGHGHPRIAEAIAAQARRLEQVIFAGFTHPPAVDLAAALAQRLPGDLERVFYSDDGSTAVEVALKIAVQYWRNRGEDRGRFVAFEGGYHGDTVGAMSVGRGSGFFAAFEGMLMPVDQVPFPATWEGDADVARREAEALAALAATLERRGGGVAAVILEPLVQGAGGMRMCRPEFVAGVARVAREQGVLLVLDEIMTGFGRTGALFACLKAGVTPDLICLSKGLTGGFLPLSVTVAREPLYQAFLDDCFDKAFVHGHSFTANPLGCAAALASLELLEAEATQARIAAIEARHRAFLGELGGLPVARPRVTGTIAALDVAAGEAGYTAAVGQRLKAAFLEAGLLIRPLGPTLYLMPPYCITDAQLDRAYAGIRDALATL